MSERVEDALGAEAAARVLGDDDVALPRVPDRVGERDVAQAVGLVVRVADEQDVVRAAFGRPVDVGVERDPVVHGERHVSLDVDVGTWQLLAAHYRSEAVEPRRDLAMPGLQLRENGGRDVRHQGGVGTHVGPDDVVAAGLDEVLEARDDLLAARSDAERL